MKTKKTWRFPLALGIYALVFLVATAIGLNILWNYMADYEATRPSTALNQYTENLTNYIPQKAISGLSGVDERLQSEESCLKILQDALKDGVTYAKNVSKSNDDKHVYSLLIGKQLVGSFTMEKQYDAQTGLSPWAVTEESFDFSYLMTEAKTFTIPTGYKILVDGNTIGEEFLVDDKIPYPALHEYYGEYTLPYLCSYTVGPFLGEPQITLQNGSGETVSFQESWDDILPGCTENEIKDLNVIANDFIRHYIDFVSKTNNDTEGNYERLCRYVVKNGQLQKHFYKAIDGLYWVPNLHASVVSLEINRYINIGDGRYLCDLTYVVNTRTYAGQVQKTENWKVIFSETTNGLKAENMIPYEN